MASMSVSVPVKDGGSLQKGLKRICRDGHEEALVKKRLMAEMKLAQRLKHDDVEGDKVLDLNPALKHTLAQFTLSSRSSLGGPAAFSARTTTDKDLSLPIPPAQPLPSPSILGTGPLLVPSDSSTELTYSVLEGESISSFLVGGEKRLCLPQILNSVLRDFALQQINAVCDELYVYCARCDGQQLHVLKMLGILPVNAPSCGLITQTDAQRLCNALLRPGTNPSTSAVPPVLNSDREGFRVEHWCMGRCRGVFVPRCYVHPEAPCVQCVKCRLLFTPQSFVMHSHQPPDKRTCHWGFDSAQWGRYLQLSTCYEGTAEESTLKKMLNQMKEKFSLHPEMLSCQVPNHELGVKTSSPDLSLHTDTLQREDPLAFSRLSSKIKQEVGSPAFIHPSFYLYDEMVAPNVSLQKNLVDRLDSLGTLLKHQYSRTTHDLHVTPSTIVKETKSYHGDEAHEHCHPPPTGITTETGIKEEDDKKQLLLEMVHMYNTQQEQLSMTLHTHLQLETELQKVRDGDGDEKELRRLSREHAEGPASETGSG
ncbi:ski-like protein isoform X2 [Trichomycterus rosablanca]|uniref:ski-like protein isoform X2 n=1 Tax=Trichomycterus rosablanca TaxID=2290929 RepID=UPI002F358BCD